ncbi:MAG: hypothetical protein JJU15_09005 [Pararhodobacter sp.]|nr:hypothetical protein [Pararhodobacter sp.]
MSRPRFPLFALSLAALPMAAAADEASAPDAAGINGARILACEADRTGEGCATLLSKLFVCESAEEMAGCSDLLALRDAAVELAEREAVVNGDATDEDDGIVTEPDEDIDEIDVEVRAEGELADELEEEALTDDEEQLREENGSDAENGAESTEDTGAGDDAGTDTGTNDDNGADRGADTDAETDADNRTETDSEAAAENGMETSANSECPVLDSSDWHAWINAMPGVIDDGMDDAEVPGLSLIVTGTVTLPTPGYDATLEPGITDRSARPVQIVNLTATAPEGTVSQVLTPYELRLEMPALDLIDGNTAAYSGVRIVCGGHEVAFIDTVEVAH